jgi:hypothetical protein
MRTKLNVCITLAFIFAALTLLIGCASSGGSHSMANYEAELKEKDKEITELKSESSEKDKIIESYEKELELSNKAAADAQKSASEAMAEKDSMEASAGEGLFPPNAKAGECWARVFVQPSYKTVTERVLKHGASERLEVIPAKYEWVEESVMVKAASERMEIIPAEYGWAEEQVLVKQASKKLVEIPASYEMREEKVLVKEAHTVWKKGRGPIEKLDNTTGEIMCLVEIPAVYKTVSKRVMVSPPTTKEIPIPAEYKTVKKRVMVKPPTERRIAIPAEYKTVKVRKMVSPAREVRTPISAEYQTVSRTEKVSDGHMAWRRVLCETNVTREVIREVQRNLSSSGYDPGPIDGEIGWRTGNALKSYQRANDLGVGGLTYETLKHMEIDL